MGGPQRLSQTGSILGTAASKGQGKSEGGRHRSAANRTRSVMASRGIQWNVLRDDGPGRAEAIDGGADNAAGIAGAFADGIDAVDALRFSTVIVSHDANRRTAAGLGAYQGRLGQESASPAPV